MDNKRITTDMTDQERLDWYLRHPDEEPEERRVFLGLYGHKRRAMAEKWIDELAAAETAARVETAPSPQRRAIVWPWWVGVAAMAACILLLVLPREAAPVEMAQVKELRPEILPQRGEIHKPQVSTWGRVAPDVTPSGFPFEEETPATPGLRQGLVDDAPMGHEVVAPETILPESVAPAEPQVIYYASASLVEYDDEVVDSHASVTPRRTLAFALGGQVVNDTLSQRFEGFTIRSI